jgi:hypothetical protein
MMAAWTTCAENVGDPHNISQKARGTTFESTKVINIARLYSEEHSILNDVSMTDCSIIGTDTASVVLASQPYQRKLELPVLLIEAKPFVTGHPHIAVTAEAAFFAIF